MEEADKIIAIQNGLCAACGRAPTGRKKRLMIDHDHKTGRVRGALCNRCNLALGLVDDNPQHLADYLERTKDVRYF